MCHLPLFVYFGKDFLSSYVGAYLDCQLILSQIEDYSIFSTLGKISIFVQKYFCEMDILVQTWIFALFGLGWVDGISQHCKLGQFH